VKNRPSREALTALLIVDDALVIAEIDSFSDHLGAAASGWGVYPANRDARARITEIESMHYGRVHRLDPDNRKYTGQTA
jgi:hypothetical protein